VRHLGLRARLGLAAGIAVAIAVIAVAISAYAGTRSVLRNQVDSQLRGLAGQQLARMQGPGHEPAGLDGSPASDGTPPGYAGPLGGGPSLGAFGHDGPCARDEGTGIAGGSGAPFGGAAGTVMLVYPPRCGGKGYYVPPAQSYRLPLDSRMTKLAASGQGQYFTDLTVSGSHLRALVMGIGKPGALVVALPLSTVDHALSSQLLLLLIIAAAGIAVAAVLGLLVARTALAPIARFTGQTEKIAANPEMIERERLEETGGDELARLARTFNETLDALERSVQAQRNLVADASHELRTPIATIRANIQLMRDEALLSDEDREALRRDVIDELDELTALVSDVVELARGSKPSAEPGDVRVDAIASATVERTQRRAPELTVRASLEPTLVRGEGDRIARAIANLLDNSAKWSPRGAAIEVDLHDGVLSIRDHGPGFHEEDLPFIFDRFHRARDARSKPGSGLGLAIVRQAAEAHGGFVEASNAPGGGALLRIGFGPRLELEDPAAFTSTA
jgi:two-component system sensor histidine kinase MprB